MFKSLFPLAIQGLLKKKRYSTLFFFVLLFSFSFALASVSLVGSIEKTNSEFRLNTYGAWYIAIPDGLDGDGPWLNNQTWADSIGISYSYGCIPTESGAVGFGSVNDTFKDIGRIHLVNGRWPKTDNEIAIEADVLSLLGYDYTLGQEVSIPIFVTAGETSIVVSSNFTLCGIIDEYTDLWILNHNTSNRLLNGAVVTEDCASQVLSEAGALLTADSLAQGFGPYAPIPQYFITVAPENRGNATQSLEHYLAESRKIGDLHPCVNHVAHQETASREYNIIYILIIAVVAMLSVMCIYILQLPLETKRFSLLRSLGITKSQLVFLLTIESLILCFPAFILGIPCSVAVTWLAIKLLIHAGSVSIQIAIPWHAMYAIVLLWIGVVVVCRLSMYFVILRTPLSGRIQLSQKKTRQAKIFRNILTLLLLSAFGFVTVFTSMEVLSPNDKRKNWGSYPPYTLWASGTISQAETELLRKVPGISRVEGFAELKVQLSYPGLEEREVYLYAVDDRQWEETFHFGEDQDSFHSGQQLLVLFPDETYYLPEDISRNFILPANNIILRLYDDAGACLLESKPTPATVRWISEHTPSKMLVGLGQPYTVVCSEAYLQSLLDGVPPGNEWGKYTAGDPFGYSRVYAYIELTADDLSTDICIAELCKKLNITLDNRREQFNANAQQYTQEVLLLIGSGLCIAGMLLLILLCTISLETEHEKNSFVILYRLGMSPRQARALMIGKALYRSIFSTIAGWFLYIAYETIATTHTGTAFLKAIPNILSYLASYGYSFSYIAIVSSFCMLITLLLTAIPKRKLKKEMYPY